jgi:molecular chaperone DnaK
MSASRPVGIDLGTTHCALARLDATGRSAMIRSVQGDLLIPSIVYFEDEELLFGRAANQAAATQPQRAAECAKRDFGQAAYSRAIGGELLPPEVVEACLLKNLCADLPEELGGSPAVVLSVPAAFDQAQRRSMVDAARIAGLDVLGTIFDPLAAALSFAEVQGFLAPNSRPNCRVLVFDLGGGKLDAAIIEIKPGLLRTLAVAGDPHLGGRDWDSVLAEYLAGKFAKQFGDDPRYDMPSVRRLLTSAEEAKHTLTARQQARVHIERHGSESDVVVQRHAFEEAASDLVARAEKVAESVIAQAGMAWKDLSHMLLVGGATRMPMISSIVESITGLKAAMNMNADEAVARGAALYAEQLLAAREGRAGAVKMNIINMTAHKLGVEWRDPGAEHAENVALISRGAELPCGTNSKVLTDEDDQTSVEVQLLEGDSRDADECRKIARVKISGLPSELSRRSAIDVLYQITAEGRLQVKAQLQKGGHALAVDIERAGGLTETEINDWKKLLATNPGMKAIHRQLTQHTAKRPVPTPPLPTARQAPPDLQSTAAGESESDDFDLDVRTGTAASMRKNAGGSRKIMIMLAGHLVFAVLGLAIGYYILMWLRPEWNVLHLRLPGLRVDSPQLEAWPLKPR